MAGRRVALITDTHFGVKKGNQSFHDYFEKFYSETFFPKIDELGIDTVIHLGDCFDVRKGIDYWSLDWAKRVVFDPLFERGIEVHIIVGNHDIFYKQSLKINSPGLNLTEYTNIKVYDSPQTAIIKNTKVFMVPWICEDNAQEFTEELAYSEAEVCMGHLELAGFYANKDYQCQHGTNSQIFSHFRQVFSGHFHKRSSSGNVTYLGNPYQMYWNDEGDTRGFHIYDLDSGELEFIENPNVMYHKIYYTPGKLINPNKYNGSQVKIIVEESSTPQKLSQLVDTLYKAGVQDVKVIENIDISVDDDVEVEAEDTLTTLTKYVNAMDNDVNKENLVNIFKSLYVEAQEV
jgi:DNA repair exonuclease SbcCD nuclease subunit